VRSGSIRRGSCGAQLWGKRHLFAEGADDGLETGAVDVLDQFDQLTFGAADGQLADHV